MTKAVIFLVLISAYSSIEIQECLQDPSDLKWYYTCPTCPSTNSTSSDNQILNHVLKNLQLKLDDFFSQDDSIHLTLNFKLQKDTMLSEEVLNKLVSNLQLQDPIQLSFAETFLPHLNEQTWIPLVIITLSISLYLGILPFRFMFYFFMTLAYILTYNQELAKYEVEVVNHRTITIDEGTNTGWYNSIFGANPQLLKAHSVPNPVKVFITMLTETIFEPFPIMAETLNKIIVTAFDKLPYMLYPVMAALIITILFIVWFLIFFKSGLTVKGRFLGGLLGDFEIGMKTPKPAALAAKSDVEVNLEKLCAKIDQLSITDSNNRSKDWGKESPQKATWKSKSPVKLITYKPQLSDRSKLRKPSLVVKKPKMKLPKITKQIGKTHCGLASLAYFLDLTEDEIWSKSLDKMPIPDGLTMDQLYSLTDTNFQYIVEKVEVCTPVNESELKKIVFGDFQEWLFIANYQMDIIYDNPDCGDYKKQSDYGHFSPLIAVDEDRVCIGDVWPEVPEHTWISYKKLFEGVDTIDSESGKLRGILKFKMIG